MTQPTHSFCILLLVVISDSETSKSYIFFVPCNKQNHIAPRLIELLPPGGLSTREEGLSVSTFPQFILLALANLLLDTLFASDSCFGRKTGTMNND